MDSQLSRARLSQVWQTRAYSTMLSASTPASKISRCAEQSVPCHEQSTNRTYTFEE